MCGESFVMGKDETKWTLVNGAYGGRKFLIRFRQFPPDFDRTKYPIRLNIFWLMSESSSVGLPLQSETVRLEQFEDRIVDAVEPDQHSVLSVVLTGDGQREFVFHTDDDSGFVERLSAMPQEAKPYPIEIRRFRDPDWKYDEGVTSSGIDANVTH
jgi:hypothetical protein